MWSPLSRQPSLQTDEFQAAPQEQVPEEQRLGRETFYKHTVHKMSGVCFFSFCRRRLFTNTQQSFKFSSFVKRRRKIHTQKGGEGGEKKSGQPGGEPLSPPQNRTREGYTNTTGISPKTTVNGFTHRIIGGFMYSGYRRGDAEEATGWRSAGLG